MNAQFVPGQTFAVNRSDMDVFSSIFDNSARGPVRWSDFDLAMTRLGFSVISLKGSRTKFTPPSAVSSKVYILHRHGQWMEGKTTTHVAKALHACYGWGTWTFVLQ